MAFKPKNSNSGNNNNFENRSFPTPKAGARKARISLIVDLGMQEREDFEDPKTKEVKPQKPCQQVAVFADLVNDVVDYGGDIGKAQYRMMLNKSYSGEVQGINFTTVPPRDKDGNLIEGKEWGFHPANLLTKLSKAVGKPEIITSLDIEQLLDSALVVDVEITEKESNKEDKDGNPIVYKYVNAKGYSKVGTRATGELDEDGNEIEVPDTVAALKQQPLCITFDNAKAEHIKFIRPALLKMIKNAQDYAGSRMQKAVEEFEANKSVPAEENKAPEKEKPKAQGKAKAAPVKQEEDDMDDDLGDAPF